MPGSGWLACRFNVYLILIMRKILAICFLLIPVASLHADEGMWLPSKISGRIDEMRSMGFMLSAEDIYSEDGSSLKDAVVLFAGGCTGELISDEGLLITNHHCGYDQIQAHSSVEHDYLTDGFWAMTREEELPNDGLEVKFLVRMEDVTSSVLKGYKEGMGEEKRISMAERNSAKIIERAEREGVAYEAQIVPMYYGNEYWLFVYQVFSDVRLVGAPPSSIGKFGGDTDNWMWPRHTGDFSLFRIYADKNNNPAPYSEDNVPYRPKRFLNISTAGVKEGDFTMVYGFPGSTKEYIISDELEYIAEKSDPYRVALRTLVLDNQKSEMDKSAGIRIKYASKNANVANAWKKWQGESKGIRKMDAAASKRKYEAAFEQWASSNGKEYAGITEKLKKAFSGMEDYRFAAEYLNEVFNAVELLGFSYRYVNSAPETRGSVMDAFFKNFHMPVDRNNFSDVIADCEKAAGEEFMPEYLNGLLSVYGHDADSLASFFYASSVFADSVKLKNASLQDMENDICYRLSESFKDFLRDEIMPAYLEGRKEMDLQYRTYMKGIMEFDSLRAFYPDANLTLRVAYGSVQGYSPADGIWYEPVSSIEGIIEKDDPSIYDYDIPQVLREIYAGKDYGRWESDGTVPVCFIATNHTTGGNSGSPVLDGNGNLVGVNFDRVWEGTMSDVVFDGSLCRNIVLDIRYALFVIDKVAGASHLIDEMCIDGD